MAKRASVPPRQARRLRPSHRPVPVLRRWPSTRWPAGSPTPSPPRARVAAALGLVKFAREGIELEDMAARIAALEAASKANEPGAPPASTEPPNPWDDDP